MESRPDKAQPKLNRMPGRAVSFILIVLAIVALLAGSWWDVLSDWLAYQRGERPLADIKSWQYQLQNVDAAEMSNLTADMLVTDYAREGGAVPLTQDEVARLKVKPDGSRRTVISYLSIGEAEQFRFYWKDEWKTRKPAWLEKENCAWPGAWMVRFWEPGWRGLIVSGSDAYLKRIVAAGFDGVYLDRVDMWAHTDKLNPQARDAMIDFVVDLATTARALKPGFIVIAQNAEDLAEDRRYRRTIDAIAKEELFYSSETTGKRNTPSEIAASLGRLKRMTWAWKPVFPVEYLQNAEDIRRADAEERGAGFVPVFPTRALDGGDPTAPLALEKEVGTPEYIKDRCPEGTSW